MFFTDMAMAFANLAKSTRPGGRLVMLVWRGIEDNEWLREFFSAIGRVLPMAPPPSRHHFGRLETFKISLHAAPIASISLRDSSRQSPVELAVAVGFEPTVGLHPHTLSRRAP